LMRGPVQPGLWIFGETQPSSAARQSRLSVRPPPGVERTRSRRRA
jgi:hypothetical protein